MMTHTLILHNNMNSRNIGRHLRPGGVLAGVGAQVEGVPGYAGRRGKGVHELFRQVLRPASGTIVYLKKHKRLIRASEPANMMLSSLPDSRHDKNLLSNAETNCCTFCSFA